MNHLKGEKFNKRSERSLDHLQYAHSPWIVYISDKFITVSMLFVNEQNDSENLQFMERLRFKVNCVEAQGNTRSADFLSCMTRRIQQNMNYIGHSRRSLKDFPNLAKFYLIECQTNSGKIILQRYNLFEKDQTRNVIIIHLSFLNDKDQGSDEKCHVQDI